MVESETQTTPDPDKPRKGLFGRRKSSDGTEQVRADKEWVDTLYPAGDEEDDVPAGSPFDTSDLPESGTVDEPVADLPPVEHRGWRRRSDETLEEIEHYVDHVLGTEEAARQRRKKRASRYAPRPTSAGFHETAVEGLGEAVPLVLPFPHDELRRARLVYETRGGYVIEITRAIDGDDDRIDTQHYTVSRVGDVGHVIDWLSRADAETKQPTADVGEESVPDLPEPAAESGAPEVAPAGGVDAAADRGPGPEAEPAPTPAENDAPAMPDTVVDEDQSADPGTVDADSPEASKKGFLSFGRRSKGDDASAAAAEDDAASDDAGDDGSGKKGFLGFGRRKTRDDEPDAGRDSTAGDPDGTAHEDPANGPDGAAEGSASKRRRLGGLLKRGRGTDDDAEDADDALAHDRASDAEADDDTTTGT